jgi:hypothetical protein
MPTRAQLCKLKIPVTLIARSRTVGNRMPAPQANYRQHCSDDRQNFDEFDQLTQEDRHRPASVFVLVLGPESLVPDDRLPA